MKPVHQTKFGGPDSSPEEMGNCYSACIASILELPLEEVPKFVAMDDWVGARDAWLRERGLWLLAATISDGTPRAAWGYYVLSGLSPRGPWHHSVVARGAEIVHDPASERYPDGPRILPATEEDPWEAEVLVPFVPVGQVWWRDE